MTTFKRTQTDKNDFPTPDGFFRELMTTLEPILNIDYDRMIDGCCTIENSKFLEGYTIKQDALKQKWYEDAKFVWLAVPFTGTAESPFKLKKHKNAKGKRIKFSIASLFIAKAVEQANEGVITIALTQTKTWKNWWGDLITYNELCHEINMIEDLQYNGGKTPLAYGASVIIFGIKKGSIPTDIHDKIARLPAQFKKSKEPNGYFLLEFFQKKEAGKEVKKRKIEAGKERKSGKHGKHPAREKRITSFLKKWSETNFDWATRTDAYMTVYPNCSQHSANTSSIRLLKDKFTKKEKERIEGKAYTKQNTKQNRYKLVPKNGKLTDNMRKFCEEYITNNKKRIKAYMIAFPNCKKESSATTESGRLLNHNPHVKAEVKRLKKLKISKISILPKNNNNGGNGSKVVHLNETNLSGKKKFDFTKMDGGLY